MYEVNKIDYLRAYLEYIDSSKNTTITADELVYLFNDLLKEQENEKHI